MDTITQIALGAAVGEAVLGRKVGNKAPLWGAVGGTIPDLDVLLTPFVSEMQGLAIHRGFSHSILFAILFAPLMGWCIHKIHQQAGAGWREWSWLAFWSVFTHPILDCFTVYGTQLFQPFSDYPVAWNAVFIIDPAYTLPLGLCVLAALFFHRNSEKRRWINYAGLGISTAYLLLAVGLKLYALSYFEESLAAQKMPYNRIMSAAMPFNTFLWMGIAEDDERQWVGLYSIFDGDRPVEFREVPKNRDLIADVMDQPPIQRLLWFSRGFYTVTEDAGDLYFNDMRFGRSDLWMDEIGRYIFSFRLIRDAANAKQISGFQRGDGARNFDGDAFGAMMNRMISRISGVH